MNNIVSSNKERIFWGALTLYLFVLPIAHTVAIRYLAFIVLIVVTLVVLIGERRMPVLPFARSWLAYFLVALASVVFAVDQRMSLSELRVEVVYCIVIFIIGVAWGGRLNRFERFAWLFAAVNLILTTAAFFSISLDMPFSEVIKTHPLPYAGIDGNWLLIVLFFNAWLVWRLWSSGHKLLSLLSGGTGCAGYLGLAGNAQ